MKTILCYGDSNTHGYDPNTMGRYPKEKRWTTMLQDLLGPEYEVINEGLNGRTTAYDRDGEPYKNGLTHLIPILYTHRPLDIVVFMLGTNDCTASLHKDIKDIKEGMEKLVDTTRKAMTLKQDCLPKIVIVSPAYISPSYKGGPFDGKLDDDSVAKSRKLPKAYEELCLRLDCIFVDASNIEVSSKDGLHLSEKGHEELSDILYEVIKKM